jgi:ABC-2 type transport system ATP-binding protein
MLSAQGLGRDYDGKWAVRDLDLHVDRGEIYGFLGPNGAGKTTTLRMLAGLLRPKTGSVRIAGLDYQTSARRLHALLGFVPDTPPLYDYLTGRQYIGLVASLWRVDKRRRDDDAERLLHLLELDDAADQICKGYSHGMRKKIHLAAVLVTRPQVLLLDEPTTGLDPLSTRRLKDLLLQESRNGTTILFSTHVLETAEQVCHRFGILHQGRLHAEGTLQQLRAAHGATSLEDIFLRLTATAAKGDDHGAAAS